MNTNRRAAETQGRRGRFSPLRFCALCVSAAINRFKPGTPCGRVSARRGVSLVELLIAMLILALVCIAWLEIIGIQSARKEARRREAVERLAGMMDAFMYIKFNDAESVANNACYKFERSGPTLKFVKDAGTNTVHAVFDNGVSPVGYQLHVVKRPLLPEGASFTNWVESSRWLVGRLFERSGTIGEAGRPFFVVPVYLGI